jgi:hypothetical protein
MLFQETADLLGIPLREPHSCEDALHPVWPSGRGIILAAHCIRRVHRFPCFVSAALELFQLRQHHVTHGGELQVTGLPTQLHALLRIACCAR